MVCCGAVAPSDRLILAGTSLARCVRISVLPLQRIGGYVVFARHQAGLWFKM
jgi:hypothetical protein